MNFNRRDLVMGGTGLSVMAAMNSSLAQDIPAPPAPAETVAHAPGNTPAQAYPVPSAERHINIITLRDLEADAQKVLPAYSFAYAAGGAGDEWTMRENEAAINRWVIEPNFLSGREARDLTTSLFGARIALPVIPAPVASHALFNTAAEAATVKGTDRAGSIYVSSSESSLSLEEIAAASQGPKWFQIYFPSDRGYARELLQRAKASGYQLIVITVDATVTSNRERVMRLIGRPTPEFHSGNKPTSKGVDPLMAAVHKRDLNWDDVAFCGAESGLPVVVKSIISERNVMQAIERGCAGVWISNHGGRQLDNTPAPMTVLPRIAEAVDGRAPIIIDGGFRRGQDIFRALALGASAVSVGRPVMYGLALGGAGGVQSVLQHMKMELQMVMQLAGTASIKEITRESVSSYLAA